MSNNSSETKFLNKKRYKETKNKIQRKNISYIKDSSVSNDNSFSNELTQSKKILLNKETKKEKEDKVNSENYMQIIDNMKNNFVKEFSNMWNEIEKLKEEMKIQRIKLDLTNSIFEQTEIYLKNNIDYLKAQNNSLINSFKVLYFQKSSNLILGRIFIIYKDKLAKTPKMFGKKKFGIIVAKSDIKKIPKLKLNLIFDYFKHIKKVSSKIINLNNFEGVITQKEVFYQFINSFKSNEDRKNEDKNGCFKIDELIKLIFDSKKEKKEKGQSKEMAKLNKIFSKYIKEEDSKDKKIKNNITKGKKTNKNTDYKEEEEKFEKEYEEDEKESGYISTNSNKSEDLLNEQKLKDIITGEDYDEKTKINNLLKTLKNKVNINEKTNNIKICKYKNISPEFYYSSWIKSLKNFKYKKTKTFKHFVNFEKNKITLEEIGNYVKILLKNEQFNFLEEEQENIDQLIQETIDLNSIKNMH